MGINEKIFDGFLRKLEEDEEIPRLVIKELKKLWESDDDISQDKIFEAIKKGCTDVCED